MSNAIISSTDNIIGNIGSCSASVDSIITKSGIFIDNVQNILINSCTGEVTSYDTWMYSGLSVVVMICVFFVIFSFFIALISRF